MEFQILLTTARSVVIELQDEKACYHTEEYKIICNGEEVMTSNKVVETLYGLSPDTDYTLSIHQGDKPSAEVKVHTNEEFVTLNVKDFRAKGDGISDDTLFLQAAILSCPKNSRVLVPKGIYKFTNLFLKSNMILELEEGAVLSAFTDKTKLPVLPGRVESYDERSEYLLASWEGNPLDSFASLITGIEVENVLICGKGTIDGCADFDNWWNTEKRKKDPARPKMLFLNNCKNVTLQGVTITNSPAWNLHPFFSKSIRFYDITILSPSKSHNTDGIDPESCDDVEIVGVYFSVGDDCIAIKSGKIYMGKTYKTPSKNFIIRHSYMKKGHGAVTIGSEIAAGVDNIKVMNCKFEETDRGLRIKTRRGRGEDSVLQNIYFKDIEMDHVQTPFVVNSFYYCDPDGKTNYVSCKDALPVDERTPSIKNLKFKNIVCKNCHVAAAYFYGLPEKKIESITMENIKVSYAKDAKIGKAAMMIGCEPSVKRGLFARNINHLSLKNVSIEGSDGTVFDIDGVDDFLVDEK